MKHGLIDWVGGLVGEDTSRKEGNKFLDLVNAAVLHNVVIDEGIFSIKFDLEWRKSLRNKGIELRVSNC